MNLNEAKQLLTTAGYKILKENSDVNQLDIEVLLKEINNKIEKKCVEFPYELPVLKLGSCDSELYGDLEENDVFISFTFKNKSKTWEDDIGCLIKNKKSGEEFYGFYRFISGSRWEPDDVDFYDCKSQDDFVNQLIISDWFDCDYDDDLNIQENYMLKENSDGLYAAEVIWKNTDKLKEISSKIFNDENFLFQVLKYSDIPNIITCEYDERHDEYSDFEWSDKDTETWFTSQPKMIFDHICDMIKAYEFPTDIDYIKFRIKDICQVLQDAADSSIDHINYYTVEPC